MTTIIAELADHAESKHENAKAAKAAKTSLQAASATDRSTHCRPYSTSATIGSMRVAPRAGSARERGDERQHHGHAAEYGRIAGADAEQLTLQNVVHHGEQGRIRADAQRQRPARR